LKSDSTSSRAACGLPAFDGPLTTLCHCLVPITILSRLSNTLFLRPHDDDSNSAVAPDHTCAKNKRTNISFFRFLSSRGHTQVSFLFGILLDFYLIFSTHTHTRRCLLLT